jgi:hypothetical protein
VGQQDSELVATEPGDDVGRTDTASQPSGRLDQHGIAGGVTERVVDVLEVVQVDIEQRQPLGLVDEQLIESPPEQGPIGESRERVVAGLVGELALQLAELTERLAELIVLESEPGVLGERFEELEVLGEEGADVADPVGDEQQADPVLAGGESGQHRVAKAPSGDVASELAVLTDDERWCGGLSNGRERLQFVVGHVADTEPTSVEAENPADARAIVRVLPRQMELDDLGPEHPGCFFEEGGTGRLHDVVGRLERPGGAVEEFHSLSLIALGHVRAVGNEEHHGRRRQEEQTQRFDDVQERHQHGLHRVDRGHHHAEEEHSPERLGSEASFGERHDEPDVAELDQARDDRDRQDHEPADRRQGVGRSEEQVEQCPRHGHTECEVGGVEGGLDRRPLQMQVEHQPRADHHRRDQHRRIDEEHAEDHRDLEERETPALGPEVHVDDPLLDHDEGDEGDHPRDLGAVRDGVLAHHEGEPGRRCEHPRQCDVDFDRAQAGAGK